MSAGKLRSPLAGIGRSLSSTCLLAAVVQLLFMHYRSPSDAVSADEQLSICILVTATVVVDGLFMLAAFVHSLSQLRSTKAGLPIESPVKYFSQDRITNALGKS